MPRIRKIPTLVPEGCGPCALIHSQVFSLLPSLSIIQVNLPYFSSRRWWRLVQGVIVGTSHRTDWKDTWKNMEEYGRTWKNMEEYGRSWKNMETGRMFGLCDHLSACMTWRCLETSRTLSFCLVSAQSLVYIRAHRPLSWKINANYLVYSNSDCRRRVTLRCWIKCVIHWGGNWDWRIMSS